MPSITGQTSLESIRSSVEERGLREVPDVIFQRDRFLIMKILSQYGEVEFKDLKHDLELSDGNLASHLRALERAGYVEFEKDFVGRKPRTIYRLTPAGVSNFQTMVYYLRRVLSNF